MSGIVVHLTSTIDHHRRVIEGLIDTQLRAVRSWAPGSAGRGLRTQVREIGFAADERDEAFALLEARRLRRSRAHRAAAGRHRRVAVTYEAGDGPHDTSPADIVGWLSDHYQHAADVQKTAAAAPTR